MIERLEKRQSTPEEVVWRKIEDAMGGRDRHKRAIQLREEITRIPVEEKRVFVETLERYQKDLRSRSEENEKEMDRQLTQGNWLAPLAGAATTLLLQVVPEGSTGDIRTDTITGVVVGVTSFFMLRTVPLIKEALSYNIADQEKELERFRKSKEFVRFEGKMKDEIEAEKAIDDAVSSGLELLKENNKFITIYHNQYGLLTADEGSPTSRELVKRLGKPGWERAKISEVLNRFADAARHDKESPYDVFPIENQVPNHRNGLTKYGSGWEWTFRPRSV